VKLLLIITIHVQSLAYTRGYSLAREWEIVAKRTEKIKYYRIVVADTGLGPVTSPM